MSFDAVARACTAIFTSVIVYQSSKGACFEGFVVLLTSAMTRRLVELEWIGWERVVRMAFGLHVDFLRPHLCRGLTLFQQRAC